MHDLIDERRLCDLRPARRNRFYYGKLMDVLHCSLEQDYVLAKEWLYNRAVLGPGVVCGLNVEPIENEDGRGVVVRAGLGIDFCGREIVVPDDVLLVPLALTDPCGRPVSHEEEPLPSEVKIEVCYDECLTDFGPTLVSDADCGCTPGCEAGTVVETYCVRVLEGRAPPVSEPCATLVMSGLKSGDLHGVLCELSRTCPPAAEDPCLTLANVTAHDDGTLDVDPVTPRTVAPTNRILMQLISCLAECCRQVQPPVDELLQVVAVRVRRRDGDPETPNQPLLGQLAPPSQAIMVNFDDRPEIVDIEFAGPPYNASTAVLGNTVVVSTSGPDQLITSLPGNVLRFWRNDGFPKGRHRFTLVGGPDSPGPVPDTLAAVDGTRLDGDFPSAGGPGWHSGDGAQGGDFGFIVDVT